LLIGSTGIFVLKGIGVLIILIYEADNLGNNRIAEVVMFLGMLLEFIFFGLSLGPLIYVYVTDILPERGFALVNAFYWLSAAMVSIPLSIIEKDSDDMRDIYIYYMIFFTACTAYVLLNNT